MRKKKARSRTRNNREKPSFKPFVILNSLEFFKRTNFDSNQLYSLMTLVMSFVTAEKKTRKRKENKYEKNRAGGKARLKKDKLNIEMFVMLNPRS